VASLAHCQSRITRTTEYWADGAANILAPGGSIQRIGYDQAAFDEAYRVVALEQEPTPVPEGQAGPSTVGIIEKEAGKIEANGDGESTGFKLNKEDLAYIVSPSPLLYPGALSRERPCRETLTVGTLRFSA
jgi:hypothetical protein